MLTALLVQPYEGWTYDGPGTDIQDRGWPRPRSGREAALDPGGVGNYQVTAHRTSSTAPFRNLPDLTEGAIAHVDAGGVRARLGGVDTVESVHELILWCGFFGAWLLVAGPLYQAAQELDEQEWSREELATASTRVDAGDRPSAWWWLIPPVGYWKHHRYNDRQRAALIAALPRDAVAKYMGYVNTATAWFYVAAGAFLIALKETWELVEGHEWPTLVFWVLIVLMFVLAAGNTASRMSRTHRLVAEP